jgi:L-threonylcarbamoyladenylate synthase
VSDPAAVSTDFPDQRTPLSGPVRAAVDAAVARLRDGGLVAFPTETVYGLGADARSDAAVRRIFAVKGRPADHPLILHFADAASALAAAREVPAMARLLADALWPGPLTLILRRAAWVSDAVTGGQDTVGVRVPAHPVAHALLAGLGAPLAAPSANRFGAVSPTTAAHVRADLGDDVDQVLDGGPAQVGLESTIVDLTREPPAILREGGVPREELAALLALAPRDAVKGAVRAPGTLAAHYAPQARVILIEADALDAERTRLTSLGARVAVIAAPCDAAETAALARDLYARLRAADDAAMDVVLAVLPAPVGLGAAIADRLRRAAAAAG